MQAMVEALEDGLAEPERYLPAMREQMQTLGRLVDDLFELARIDAGALTLDIREAPLSGLVESCLRGVEAEAAAKHISASRRRRRPRPPSAAPPTRSSACCSTCSRTPCATLPRDGSVAVLVEPLAEEVRVTVEDTGEGIPADHERRVFERFWRGDRARTPGRAGAGLGLAIARGLVEAQGGRIWAENRPGGGAGVSFHAAGCGLDESSPVSEFLQSRRS